MANANFIESGETVTAQPSIPITGEVVIPEEIHLHSTLPTQTAIKGGKFQIINVQNAIERKGLISFRIMSGDNQFIDPYNTYILITSSIKNPEGGNIPTRATGAHNPVCNVLPVNGLGTAWFKKIDVKLNGTTVSFDGNMYSYKVDIENRLSYPNMIKKGHLSMIGFDEEMEAFDEINNADIHWDDADPAEHAYPAILTRYLKRKASKNMYTTARIHSEIFEQLKLLPPNTVLDIDFDRHDSDFLLLTKHNNRNYILKMESCEILTRLVDMDEEITAEIDSVSISGRSMLYPVRRVKIMYYSCGANIVDLSNFNLLTTESNLLPCRIIVVMVREDAVHGNYNRDPFNYQHFNLAEFSLKVGSGQIPLPKLKCNMDDDSNDILRPLSYGLLANHSLFSNEESGTNPSNYRNGNVFLAWDLSQMPPGQSFEMTQEKSVSLILKLRRVNNFVINVTVYSEYDSEVEMLNNRKVICHEYAFKKHAKSKRNLPTPLSKCVILK